MLIKARQWIRETFSPESRPTMRQVREWVENGDLPGQVIGDHVYINDAFATKQPERVQPNVKLDLLA